MLVQRSGIVRYNGLRTPVSGAASEKRVLENLLPECFSRAADSGSGRSAAAAVSIPFIATAAVSADVKPLLLLLLRSGSG